MKRFNASLYYYLKPILTDWLFFVLYSTPSFVEFCSMKLYKNYVDYFENLCVQHVNINHNPANNTKGFFKINIEEVLTGIRSEINADGIYFVLTNYLWSPDDKTTDSLKKIECMFFVLGTVPEQDYEAQTNTFHKTEQIVQEFINRMRLDSLQEANDENAFFYGTQDVINIENVVPVKWVTSNQSIGWQVTFSFYSHYNKCVDFNLWNDKADADSCDPTNY